MLRFLVSLPFLVWLEGCGSCEAPCGPLQSVVLVVKGYVTTSVESNCTTQRNSFPGSPVIVQATLTKTTCHVDVGLDDGQHVLLDVPFDKQAQQVCCSSSTTVYVSSVPVVELDAPAGYVPKIDAGADAGADANADASDAAPE